jgi:hypothetical protein
MKFTKAQGRKASDLRQQWRTEGVPDLITSFEAHRLTEGKVGVPYSHKRHNEPMRLIDVAIRYAKAL